MQKRNLSASSPNVDLPPAIPGIILWSCSNGISSLITPGNKIVDKCAEIWRGLSKNSTVLGLQILAPGLPLLYIVAVGIISAVVEEPAVGYMMVTVSLYKALMKM